MHLITIGYLRLLTIVLPYHCEAFKCLVYSFHLVEVASLEYFQQTTYTPTLKLNCNNVHKMTKASSYQPS